MPRGDGTGIAIARRMPGVFVSTLVSHVALEPHYAKAMPRANPYDAKPVPAKCGRGATASAPTVVWEPHGTRLA